MEIHSDRNVPTRPVTPFLSDLDEAITTNIKITVNDTEVKMNGKREYIFVDIYNYYDFDPTEGEGRRLVTKINGTPCGFADPLHDKDVVELIWEERGTKR